MFARKFRLPSSVVFSAKPFLATSFCIVKKKENRLIHNRYGFIVSKKIDKRSTVRNRIKRVFRSCFEILNAQMSQGEDFLVIARKEAMGKTTEQMVSSLGKLLIK